LIPVTATRATTSPASPTSVTPERAALPDTGRLDAWSMVMPRLLYHHHRVPTFALTRWADSASSGAASRQQRAATRGPQRVLVSHPANALDTPVLVVGDLPPGQGLAERGDPIEPHRDPERVMPGLLDDVEVGGFDRSYWPVEPSMASRSGSA
jgi:hypothetical protein